MKNTIFLAIKRKNDIFRVGYFIERKDNNFFLSVGQRKTKAEAKELLYLIIKETNINYKLVDVSKQNFDKITPPAVKGVLDLLRQNRNKSWWQK